MGFYGNKNITANSSKSAFVFDRIYANRRDMDKAADTDGVYIGRFVLVDYGVDGSMNEVLYTPVFIKPNTNPQEFYTSAEFEEETRIIEGDNRQGVAIKEGDIVYTKEYTSEPTADELENMVKVFYICTGSDENGYATFSYVTMETKNKYTQNYNLDLAVYTDNNGGRGFDSTVWQKVYISSDNTLGAKYVQVAELNSVVPTFNLTYDAPTLYPNAPHFDTNSTNLYYNLHVQPSWGLKVMAAEAQHKQGVDAPHKSTNNTNYPSDIQMGYYRKYVDENGKEQQAFEFYPGAIYYNKAGFDSKKSTYATTVTDELTITPTGISKNKYNIHGQAQQEERVDTHEIKVMLPSIGNAIAKVWDLVYGDTTANGGVERNQDVSWDSTKGLRLIEKLNENYSINPHKVETIAGCINSVHDLMGMIIINNEADNITANNAEFDRVYFNKDGLFYIKGLDYIYTPIDIDKNVEVDFNNWVTYKKIENLTDFKKGQFYQKKVNDSVPPEAERNADFVYTTGDLIKGADYYTVEASDIEFTNIYVKDSLFYKKDGVDATPQYWVREHDDEPKKNTAYYIVKTLTIQNPYMKQYIFNTNLFKDDKVKFFERIEKDDGSLDRYQVLTADETNPPVYNKDSKGYYRIDVSELEEVLVDDGAGNFVYSYKIPDEIAQNLDEYKIQFTPFDRSATYYIYSEQPAEDLEPVELNTENDIITTKTYYIIFEVVPCGSFYFPNTYYYKKWLDADKTICDYILETEDRIIADREHVILKETLNTNPFYEPNKYYYQLDEGIFVLDSSLEMKNTDYYTHDDLYVYEDELGLIPPGTVWNQAANIIPDSITLATREEKYAWLELPGFARDLNTIHGLIVRINNLLLEGDTETRDSATVQGAINKLNDIIYKFSSLVPRQLVIVDSYGKIHSATQDSNQYYTTTNCKEDQPGANTQGDLKQLLDDKKAELAKSKPPAQEEEETAEDFAIRLEEYENYILDLTAEISELEELTFKPIVQVDITSDPATPRVKVLHKFYPEEGEQDSIDFNDTEETSFTVHSPIVDNYGHTVGHNYLDITLPNEYQTITTSNTGATGTTFNTEPAQSKIELQSNSITGTLNFNSGNKWISFNSDNTSKTITIYHNKASTDILTDAIENTQAPSFGASFNIPTLNFDAAGHLSSVGTKTVSLPGLSAEVEGETKKDVITSITPSSSGVLTFATEDVDQFTLKNYGTAGSFVNSGLTIAGAFKAIDAELKSLGDRTTTLENTYLTKTNAESIYLTKTNAESIYLTQTNAESIYLTQTNAESIYLTQTNAANTYLTPTVADSKYLAASKESSFVLLATYEAKIAELEGKITELTNKVNAAHPAEQQ